jgi:hypothetical protein
MFTLPKENSECVNYVDKNKKYDKNKSREI